MRTSGRTRKAAVIAVAGLATCATLITGCSSKSDNKSDGSTKSPSNEQITLRIGDFGSFGYDDKTGAALFAEYHKLHPNITIKEDNVADSGVYWNALKLHLNQNSGLDDIQAIEIGFVAEATKPQFASKFVDFSKVKGFNASDWVDYKEKEATTTDGQIIGLGTDIGPTAICYRKDMFKQAGLPTDRDTVAAQWNGDWQKFIDMGKQFKANGPKGVAWTDAAAWPVQRRPVQPDHPVHGRLRQADLRLQPGCEDRVGPRLPGCRERSDGQAGPVHRQLELRLQEQQVRHRGLPELDGRPGRHQLRSGQPGQLGRRPASSGR